MSHPLAAAANLAGVGNVHVVIGDGSEGLADVTLASLVPLCGRHGFEDAP